MQKRIAPDTTTMVNHTLHEPGSADVESLHLPRSITIYDLARIKSNLFAAVDRHAKLILDLSAVEHIDTAGIQLLMMIESSASSKGHHAEFVKHSPAVIRVIEHLKLSGHLNSPMARARKPTWAVEHAPTPLTPTASNG